MVPIHHFEVPHLALWKSCVAKVIAQNTPQTSSTSFGIDTEHPLMKATDAYCFGMMENNHPANPGTDSEDEHAIHTYLSYLHHKMAHLHIADMNDSRDELKNEIALYKFGNPLWQQMFIEYYTYYWQYPYHKGRAPKYKSWQDPQYGKGDLNYGVVEWKLPSSCRIIIVGDIGTGTHEAIEVIRAALRLKPHAILHLGDVYFSGTKEEIKYRLVEMVKKAMELENRHVPFFTVPGNHEYFTGAVPYFEMLDAGELIIEKDQLQKASYFCLRTEDDGWQFLGMDTGYNGHYMNVTKNAQKATLEYLHIGDIEKPNADMKHWPTDHNPYFLHPDEANLKQEDTSVNVPMVVLRDDEALWHNDKLTAFPGRSILLSHHQLYSALDVCGIQQKNKSDGKTPDPSDTNRIWVNTGLWQQLGKHFGDQVAAWIWGHEHNLVIFEDNYRPMDWPQDQSFIERFKTLPKGRCAGHSAIPVQDTEGPYKINYPIPFINNEVKLGLRKIENSNWYNHGFQLMEIYGKGNAARLSYFEIDLIENIPLPIYVESIK